MLKLNDKEYNLDNLFGINFDLLKEVLLALSKNYSSAKDEINIIKNADTIRDSKISELQKKLTELNNKIIQEKEKIIQKIDKKIEQAFKAKENKEKDKYKNLSINTNEIDLTRKEFNKGNFIIMNKIDDFIISKNELDKQNHANTENEVNPEVSHNNKNNNMIINTNDINNNNNENNNIDNNNINIKNENIIKNKKKFDKIIKYYKKKPKLSKKLITDINLIDISLLSKINKLKKNKPKDSNTNNNINLLYEINDIKDRMNFIEKAMNLKLSENLKISKDLLSEHNIQSMSKFNTMEDTLSKLKNKYDNLDTTLATIIQKLEKNFSISIEKNKNPEIITIFNDNEENKDNNNVPDKFLEGINKRFDMNDERYMKLFEDNFKLNQSVVDIKGLYDNLEHKYDINKKITDEIMTNVNKIKDDINELFENINNGTNNKKFYGGNKNLMGVNEYIDKKIKELTDNLLKGIYDSNDNSGNNNVNISNDNYKLDKSLLKLLNQRVNEFKEKLEIIDEENILQKKNFNAKFKEINDLSYKINELNEKMVEKLEKKNLEEINTLIKTNTEDINNIKLKVEELILGQEKIFNDNPNFIKRLESLTKDILTIKENFPEIVGTTPTVKNEYHTKVEEINNIDTMNEEKIKNLISPLADEIQKLILETENLNLQIKSLLSQNKLMAKKKYIEKLEYNYNNKFDNYENILETKYLKKIDFNKIIKTLEIQIKQMQGNNNANGSQKNEAESWILAKQPLKCFNCASCEAKINNVNPNQQNEHLFWNKYHGKYHIGQGFSKLLNKLNSNSISNKPNDDNKKINLNSSFENLSMNKNDNIKLLNKRTSMDENSKPYAMSLKKYKLPRLIESFRKRQKSTDLIPVSDDENEKDNSELDENSPKILKITKLKNEDIANISDMNYLIKNKTGRNSAKRQNNDNNGNSNSNNLNRIQSLPVY